MTARVRTLTICRTVIDERSDCYVIAEIGHNHQGDPKKARDLILAAKDSGAIEACAGNESFVQLSASNLG